MLDVSATNPANHFEPATKVLTHRELSGRWTVFGNASEFLDVSLGYLRRLNTTKNVDFGCENLLDGQKQYEQLAHGQHYGAVKALLMTLMKGMTAQMQCVMLMGQRPSPMCRFDRRQGTYYPSLNQFEHQGKLVSYRHLPDTWIKGTKYELMCAHGGNTYLRTDTCEGGWHVGM
jgi:hypothetical protein